MRTSGNLARGALALGLLLLGPGVARGSDGAIGIGQACAVNAGCVAGDAPGFPVSIGSGRYVLTSNLNVSDPAVDAIEVLASGVTIDLNGFEIRGPVTCSGSGPSLVCAPAGSGRGIDAFARSRVLVRDGSVSGFGSHGIYTGEQARIESVISSSNGGSGMRLGNRSFVSVSIADGNGANGIEGLDATLVEASVASFNRFDGIQLNVGSSVLRSVSSRNGDDGVNTGAGCLVEESTTWLNEGSGIEAGTANLVSESTSSSNTAADVGAGSGSAIQRITVRAVGSFGLDLAADASYRNVTIRAFAPAGTVNGGVDMGSNSCNGTGACP